MPPGEAARPGPEQNGRTIEKGGEGGTMRECRVVERGSKRQGAEESPQFGRVAGNAVWWQFGCGMVAVGGRL